MVYWTIARQLVSALVLVGILLGIGTAGYVLLEGVPPLDALYMTVITISTVGYSEVVPATSEWTRLFTILLIFFGIGIFFWVASEVAEQTIRTEIQETLGRRSLQRILEKLKGHYIVCGYGRMGRSVVEFLTERKIPLVVIDPDEEASEQLRQQGVPYIIDDAAAEEVLKAAGIRRAAGLIACTGSDAVNVYITLTARDLNPNLKIVARSDDEAAEPKLRRAGADQVVSPYRIGAERIAYSLLRPAVVNFMELAIGGRHGLQIEELVLPAPCRFHGKTLAEAELRNRYGVIVLAIQQPDGALEISPGPDAVLRSGQRLILMGTRQQLESFVSEVSNDAA